MKIGKLAEQMGIAPSTIRYYEQEGLIEAPERISGQRHYDESVLPKLKLIQLAQAAGFTIGEIRLLFQGYAAGKPLSEGWFEVATTKKREVDQKIRELKQMKAVLNELLECQCVTVEACVDHALDDMYAGETCKAM